MRVFASHVHFMTRIQMAAHWDIKSLLHRDAPGGGKNLSEREALNLEERRA